MRWQSQKRLISGPPLGAIYRLGPVGVDALDRHLDRLHIVAVALQGYLDDGVKRNVDIGHLLDRSLQEVGQNAT